jgi:hypothetical protein
MKIVLKYLINFCCWLNLHLNDKMLDMVTLIYWTKKRYRCMKIIGIFSNLSKKDPLKSHSNGILIM